MNLNSIFFPAPKCSYTREQLKVKIIKIIKNIKIKCAGIANLGSKIKETKDKN